MNHSSRTNFAIQINKTQDNVLIEVLQGGAQLEAYQYATLVAGEDRPCVCDCGNRPERTIVRYR